jgi:FkbM family methyltransferase
LLNHLRTVRRILRDKSNQGRRCRRVLASVGWQIWKRTIHKPLKVKLLNGYRFVAYRDCDSSSKVMYFYISDHREITLLREKIQGGVLVDVAAKVGLFTLSLADKVDTAILFEPNVTAAQRAELNMAENHLEFEVHATALSDEVGECFLEDRGRVDTTSRTLTDPQTTSFSTRKVRRTTLDIFLENHVNSIKNIALVKIDVEGHEKAVLRSMRKTLVNLRPQIVMFEYLQRTNFSEAQECSGTAGYITYSLDGQGNLTPVVGKLEPLQDLFALPAEQIC